MNPASIDIKDMLAFESISSLEYAVNLFIGRESELPNNCVTIFDTAGLPIDLTLDQKSNEHPSILIRIRNTDYAAGFAVAEAIKDILHGRANETWNNSYYQLILCVNGPSFLAWDNNNRCQFSINFNLQRRQTNE